MRFNILLLISFFCISGVLNEENIPRAILSEEIKENSPVYDSTKTFVTVITDVLNTLSFNLDIWRHNLVTLSHDVMVTNYSLPSENYSVSFDTVYIKNESTLSSLNRMKISCEFAKNLTIQVPFNQNAIKFYGNIDVINNTNGSHIKGSYNVTFFDIHASITAKSDFNSTIISPSKDLKVDITYKNFKVDIAIDPDVESIATVAVGRLINEIKSYLTLQTYEKFTAIVREKVVFWSLLDTCIHPKNQISRINETFLSQEEKNYYIIEKKNVSFESTRIITRSITYKGLTNFQVINGQLSWSIRGRPFVPARRSYFHYQINLHIKNLEGVWKYSLNNDKHNSSMPFKIDQISIGVAKNPYRGYRRPSIYVYSTPIFAVAQSKDTYSSLPVTVLEDKLSSIIISDLESAVQRAFSAK